MLTVRDGDLWCVASVSMGAVACVGCRFRCWRDHLEADAVLPPKRSPGHKPASPARSSTSWWNHGCVFSCTPPSGQMGAKGNNFGPKLHRSILINNAVQPSSTLQRLIFTIPCLFSMPSSSSPTDALVAGQSKPVWSGSEPLALLNDHYVPARIGYPPPGTVPDDILPAGVSRPKLFDSVDLPHSKLKLKNRAIVSPMCQYSSDDGFITPYHLAHLGSFALHGAGTIMIEASAVTPEGRITPQDVGIWKDEHIVAHSSLLSSLKAISAGLTVGIQLAHAGRKASDWSPYYRGDRKNRHYITRAEGGWDDNVVAPSALPYDEGHITPKELTTQEVKDLVQNFFEGARRAFKAGYDFVEVHR